MAEFPDAIGIKKGFTLTVQAWDQSNHLPLLFFVWVIGSTSAA